MFLSISQEKKFWLGSLEGENWPKLGEDKTRHKHLFAYFLIKVTKLWITGSQSSCILESFWELNAYSSCIHTYLTAYICTYILTCAMALPQRFYSSLIGLQWACTSVFFISIFWPLTLPCDFPCNYVWNVPVYKLQKLNEAFGTLEWFLDWDSEEMDSHFELCENNLTFLDFLLIWKNKIVLLHLIIKILTVPKWCNSQYQRCFKFFPPLAIWINIWT